MCVILWERQCVALLRRAWEKYKCLTAQITCVSIVKWLATRNPKLLTFFLFVFSFVILYMFQYCFTLFFIVSKFISVFQCKKYDMNLEVRLFQLYLSQNLLHHYLRSLHWLYLMICFICICPITIWDKYNKWLRFVVCRVYNSLQSQGSMIAVYPYLLYLLSSYVICFCLFTYFTLSRSICRKCNVLSHIVKRETRHTIPKPLWVNPLIMKSSPWYLLLRVASYVNLCQWQDFKCWYNTRRLS